MRWQSVNATSCRGEEPASEMWYPEMLIGLYRFMLRAQYVMQSRTIRTDGSMGKMYSFCAMYSLRMSAWMVPESLFRSNPRFSASTTYMASRIHALGLMVSESDIF